MSQKWQVAVRECRTMQAAKPGNISHEVFAGKKGDFGLVLYHIGGKIFKAEKSVRACN